MSTLYERKRDRIIKYIEMHDTSIYRAEMRIDELRNKIKTIKRGISKDIDKREKLLTPLYKVTRKWDNE